MNNLILLFISSISMKIVGVSPLSHCEIWVSTIKQPHISAIFASLGAPEIGQALPPNS